MCYAGVWYRLVPYRTVPVPYRTVPACARVGTGLCGLWARLGGTIGLSMCPLWWVYEVHVLRVLTVCLPSRLLTVPYRPVAFSSPYRSLTVPYRTCTWSMREGVHWVPLPYRTVPFLSLTVPYRIEPNRTEPVHEVA